MELLQLQYFKALAEKNHLTATAQELFISAPSLSATISRLEKELGMKLFDRVGRNIYLNEYGAIFLGHVQKLFTILENAKQEIALAQNNNQNKLSIGITSIVIWDEAFLAFMKENKNIALSPTILQIDKLKDLHFCSQFDFIITAMSDLPQSEWNHEILIPNDKPVLAVYPSHPFAKRKKIHFEEAKDENFIVLSQGYSMRKYVEDLCASAGFSPKIAMECDCMLRSKMLASEQGIGVITESGKNSGLLENTVFVEIIDPGVKRVLAIYWNKQRYLSKAAAGFLDFMINYYPKSD